MNDLHRSPAAGRVGRAVLAAALTLAVAGIGAPSVAAVSTPGLAASDATPPVVSQPHSTIRGGKVTAASVPFAVTWSASDPSGIARYRLQQRVDGGSWQSLVLPSATATRAKVRLRPGHEHQFRVRAVDRAGNRSDWVLGDPFWVRRMSERTPDLATVGAWKRITSADLLGSHALRSKARAAEATLTFTGSQVAWFGTRAPSRGKARVLLDGRLVATIDLHRSVRKARRVVFHHTWAASSTHTITIRVVGTPGHPAVDVDGFVVVRPPAVDPVLVGAGDVSYCTTTWDSKTAALLDRIGGRVFVAGDLAYPNGTAAQLRNCYGPTWGRWKLRTSPVPGNHEYHSAGAAPYFAYFGARAGTAGKGWYAYDLGTWRIYSLNANCLEVGCGSGSEQLQWLQADLAAHPRACVAAIWHQPLFSSGMHGSNAAVRPLWGALEDAGAELILNGHDHDYERFAPQTASGIAAPDGIREFVVGTGGGPLRPFASIKPNSVVRNAATYGVLKLTLRDGSYDWTFVPIKGQTFTDSGSAACH